MLRSALVSEFVADPSTPIQATIVFNRESESESHEGAQSTKFPEWLTIPLKTPGLFGQPAVVIADLISSVVGCPNFSGNVMRQVERPKKAHEWRVVESLDGRHGT